MGLLDVMLNARISGMSECFSTDLLNIRRKKRKILCFQHGRKHIHQLQGKVSLIISVMISGSISLKVAKRRRTPQFLSIKYYPSTSVILPGFNARFSSQTY